MTYFNDNEPYAAAWLRNLWPEAVVDDRSIVDVRAIDLRGFTRCHLFGGIGGWEYALYLAGWPQWRGVWTGSCPCQPFSVAGKRGGTADKRHLWPEMFRLIRECRPATVFGEQVGGPAGLQWLDGVFADLESCDYACAAADLPAAGVGAPHIRQRLFWVAQSRCEPAWRGLCRPTESHAPVDEWTPDQFGRPSGNGRLGNPVSTGLAQRPRQPGDDGPQRPSTERAGGDAGRMADAVPAGRPQGWPEPGDRSSPWSRSNGRMADTAGAQFRPVAPAWNERSDASNDWLYCLDGKARRVESGTFPLATRLSEDMGSNRPGEDSPYRTIIDPKTGQPIGQAPWRIGMLRGYGNAIVPQVAAEFIRAFMETNS